MTLVCERILTRKVAFARTFPCSKTNPKSMCTTSPDPWSTRIFPRCRSPIPRICPTMLLTATERVKFIFAICQDSIQAPNLSRKKKRSDGECRAHISSNECLLSSGGLFSRCKRHVLLLHSPGQYLECAPIRPRLGRSTIKSIIGKVPSTHSSTFI